jgi:hypothetical protein
MEILWFTVKLLKGQLKIFLNKPDICLINSPSFSSIRSDFSKNSICLVLTNGPYDEKEYVRNKADFIALR